MANVLLKNLVNQRRFPDDNFLNIILYFPFGLILVLFRIAIGIFVWLASAILPELSSVRVIIKNITCFALGIHVKQIGQRDDKTRVIVSNSVSIFDSLALHLISCSVSPSKWDLPPPLAWALGIRNLPMPSSMEQYPDAVKRRFADIPNIPLAVQPEGCPTSGKGVLKFSDWPFMICDKVQPAALEVGRWFGNVTIASLSHWANDSIAWSDVFWFLWNPYTVFTIHMMPSIERADKETAEEFANRVQKIIAGALEIEGTEYTNTELKELITKYEAERARESGTLRQQTSSTSISAVRADLKRMANQVKEVLPAVPLAIILKDLSKTRSVDITLSNILEGVVPYTPEEAVAGPAGGASEGSASSTGGAGVAGPSQLLTGLRTGATSFPKTAHDRQLSYQDRKAQLIQAARARFIQKHGLSDSL